MNTTSIKLTFTDSFAKYSSPSKKIRTASALFKNAADSSGPDTSEDGTRKSSNLLENKDSSSEKLFFNVTSSTSIIDPIIQYLVKNKEKNKFKSFEFAMIIDEENCSYSKYYIGKSAKSDALKYAESLDPKYCIITFDAHINMSGKKQVTVLNPSSKLASGDNVIQSLKKIGEPGHAHGTIIINLDDFARSAVKIFEAKAK
jgi:hypothetical protein